jgi:hypothetical protein
MVVRRDRFERVYDLTERVIPASLLVDLPSETATRRFFVGQALAALGVATPRWVADYFRSGARPHVPPAAAARELQAMAAEGLARRVVVDGITDPVWLDPALVGRIGELRAGRGRPTLTTLLSPFDNLIWHRERTQTLFGFEYRLESYTPAARRQYGYYTLPILHRGQIVGRLDPSYDRRTRVLTAKAVHLEPGIPMDADLVMALADTLADLANFLGGDTITVVASNPPSLARALGATAEGERRQDNSCDS